MQRRIREAPSDEKPATGAPNQPTYDMMLGQLLSDVWREGAWMTDGASFDKVDLKLDGKKIDEKAGPPSWAEGAIPESKVEALGKALKERLTWHLAELDKRDEDVKKEIESEEALQKKKITSDDIHEGWDASSVAKPKPSPLDDKPKVASKPKETKEVIEVLNPGTVRRF